LATLWVMLFFVGGLIGLAVAALGHAAGPRWRIIASLGAAAPLFFGFGTLIEACRYSFLSSLVSLRRRASKRGNRLRTEHLWWPFASSDTSVLLQLVLTVVLGVALAAAASR
jgi:hypothetical protein